MLVLAAVICIGTLGVGAPAAIAAVAGSAVGGGELGDAIESSVTSGIQGGLIGAGTGSGASTIYGLATGESVSPESVAVAAFIGGATGAAAGAAGEVAKYQLGGIDSIGDAAAVLFATGAAGALSSQVADAIAGKSSACTSDDDIGGAFSPLIGEVTDKLSEGLVSDILSSAIAQVIQVIGGGPSRCG